MVLHTKDKIVFLLLFLLLLFISLNRHSQHPPFDYHSELYTDKAGYHVYLPAFFYYQMDGEQMPTDIDKKTGTGFKIRNKKIITKYPIGVSLFELPFFGVAAAIDSYNSISENKGYTTAHHKVLSLSGVFYGTIGLLLFFIIAIRFWKLSRPKAYLLLLMVLCCSNLLYYITRDPGMSHVYSFFVFASLLYTIYQCVYRGTVHWYKLMLMIFLASLVIVLRPLNILFLAFPIVYILLTHKQQIINLEWIKPSLGIGIGVLLALVPIGLQMAYNQYAFGTLIADSYASESFSRWYRMDLLAFWFGANNGVFIYIPILLLVVIWVVRQLLLRQYTSLLFIGYILAISLTYAAWWSPTLGCGFGHRGFTEHLVFFALPMAAIVYKLNAKNTRLLWFTSAAICVLLFIGQYNFDDCWRGNGPWDWQEFFHLFRL
jgi:hypothetical protein